MALFSLKIWIKLEHMDRPEVGIGRQKIESGGHFSTAARNGGWIFCLHLWPKSINRRGPTGLHVRSQTIQFDLEKPRKWHFVSKNVLKIP